MRRICDEQLGRTRSENRLIARRRRPPLTSRLGFALGFCGGLGLGRLRGRLVAPRRRVSRQPGGGFGGFRFGRRLCAGGCPAWRSHAGRLRVWRPALRRLWLRSWPSVFGLPRPASSPRPATSCPRVPRGLLLVIRGHGGDQRRAGLLRAGVDDHRLADACAQRREQFRRLRPSAAAVPAAKNATGLSLAAGGGQRSHRRPRRWPAACACRRTSRRAGSAASASIGTRLSTVPSAGRSQASPLLAKPRSSSCAARTARACAGRSRRARPRSAACRCASRMPPDCSRTRR